MSEAPSFEADVIDIISDGEQDPRCDAACKKVLSCKEFAAPILKYVCTEYDGMETDDIIALMEDGIVSGIPLDPDAPQTKRTPVIDQSNSESSTLKNGTRFFDIRFNVKAPSEDGYIQLIINLEAQNANKHGYSILKRALYYCSRMISDQFGTVFTGSDYGKIRKVYSIWVCLHPDKNYTDTIARFSVKKEIIHGETRLTLEEETKERKNYDLINMTIVGLKDFKAAAQSEHPLIRMLSLIFTNKLNAKQKKEMLENDYNIQMTENIEEEFDTMCDFSKGFYQEGIAEGIAEGEANIIKKLLRKLDPKQISSMLEIPLDEVEKVKQSIAQQN